jgi:uncharacterized membrane protein
MEMSMEKRKNEKKPLVEGNGQEDKRNAKEKIYDKIPISLKTLDIVIGVLIAILVVLILYFVIRRFI